MPTRRSAMAVGEPRQGAAAGSPVDGGQPFGRLHCLIGSHGNETHSPPSPSNP